MTHPANTNSKPEAHIERWAHIKMPEGIPGLGFLTGSISRHERQDEFHQPYQRTTMMGVFEPGLGYMETTNTFYTLGAEYTDQMQHADEERLKVALKEEADNYELQHGVPPKDLFELMENYGQRQK